MNLIKQLLKALLGVLYRVRVRGLEHYDGNGGPLLIVANHTSFLDALLLAVFLPHRPVFAIHTKIAQRWWMRPFASLVTLFPMDPANPLSVKGLIRCLKQGEPVVIFPEGRITVTGSLMKVYDGAAMAADKAGARVLPIRLDGPQFTPFSRLQGRFRLRWFPPVSLTLRPPVDLGEGLAASGHARREALGVRMTELMGRMVFETTGYRKTLFQALLDARAVHGGGQKVIEDMGRAPLDYDGLISRAHILGRKLSGFTRPGENLGLLLPSSVPAVALFFGASGYGRTPAMLNFTVGEKALSSACATAGIAHVVTSRRFVEAAELGTLVERLAERVRVHYLEDWKNEIGAVEKLRGWLSSRLGCKAQAGTDADAPAVILFTSGSEGAPKGVVLSHANLMANQAQLAARVDFSPADVVCNALPIFHSFGLTAGTLLPVLAGLKCFLYPSPLHYKVVPEIAYDISATVMFGTNTFLAGYGRHAHPYDFFSLRYVFAGAEKLTAETRELWMSKFGKRILEGYGATETSPVIAVNTAMAAREGTVGRFLPGIDWRLEAVPGIERGGRLQVKGPNVMLGYLLPDSDGALKPPPGGWYDTGDIVEVDEEGFISIRGRAKRFAKIGGEMVSLGVVEELAAALWHEGQHAAVSLPDPRKGEQVILFTTQASADRAQLATQARVQGVSELHVPRRVIEVPKMPLLGTGKTDYRALQLLAEGEGES